MRILKLLTLCVAAIFIAVFAYANFRSVSPTEKLRQVHLASFSLTGDLSPGERTILEKKISNEKGVTACSINASATLASITFYPDQQSEASLVSLLTTTALQASKRELSTAGGCPIHGVTASVSTFLLALDLRN